MANSAEFNSEQIFANVELNPQLGAQLAERSSWIADGVEMARVAVRIRPEQAIRTHLHTCGGEEMIAHTRTRLALGDARRDESGQYVTVNNQEGEPEVIADNWEYFIMNSGDRMIIPEGKTHFIGNPEQDYGYVEFELPRAHFDVNNPGGVDRKWVVPPVFPANLQT